MAQYDHKQIEEKWRKYWEEEDLYVASDSAAGKEKMYILPQLPYPSGSGLHMGHSIVYTACDVYARYYRMNNKNVLQTIGWDAFGLPAENYAIKTNVHPRISTNTAIENFREQIKLLGIGIDWNRSIGSHEPEYYKWTQWLFLLMYKRGLAYRKKQSVNWCESCKTVLANEQVVDGKCERCGTIVAQKEMEQWFLRITEYADRLVADLDKVNWPEETKKRQRDWIGRSEGARVRFSVLVDGEEVDELEVFTTAYDTIYGATFMVVAPEHPILNKYREQIRNNREVEAYISTSAQKSELDRQTQKEKTGIKLEGLSAINPMTKKEIPIFVADYVLFTYGTGAIMAVPGHDERDVEFAKKYDLPVVFVTQEQKLITYSEKIRPNLKKYIVANSDEFSGMTFEEARPRILTRLEEMGCAERKVEYKLRDWSVSRQRFWGAPIPMVYDPEGNPHPVSDDDLPVLLPDDVDFVPTGRSPLTYSDKFQLGVEEKYGKGWRREVDTLDTFMCSSWYYMRYVDPHNDKAFASREALDLWMPVDFYLGGQEHVNGHLLYSRFFTKVLYDAGLISVDEPFKMNRHQGMILGEDNRKMSKRWGNIVNPTDVVADFGADTARMYLMFMGPLEQDKAWSTTTIQGVHRFIKRIYKLQDIVVEDGKRTAVTQRLVRNVSQAINNLRFNVAVADFMKVLNTFEEQKEVSRADWEVFLLTLAPFAPYITEELWSKLGYSKTIHYEQWPSYDPEALEEESVTLAVQINGKLRDTILISKEASEQEVLKLTRQSKKINTYLDGKNIIKVIFVPGKVINFIVK